MKDNVTILGGRGMLGSDLAALLGKSSCDVRVYDLPECDVTRREHVAEAIHGSDVIVNCAAYTQVDRAEDEPELARAVNADAPGIIGELADANGVFVIHVSTDFVFDGSGDAAWTEEDVPRPISVYGQTKLEGERILRETGCQHAIMRVQWSYGANGVNFVTKLRERAAQGGDLKVVDDQVGAPTWTRDMADAISCLAKDRATGLFHFANSGYASRYETALFILDKLGLKNRVASCSTSDFPARAARPLNSRFDTGKIRSALGISIRSWQNAMEEFLA